MISPVGGETTYLKVDKSIVENKCELTMNILLKIDEWWLG